MKKILFVNTVIVFYERNKSFLNRDEFKIFTANTAKEALHVHRQERVDLIIAELNMPDMAGDELCAHVRMETDLKNVSIILACGGTPEDRDRVAQCGANAWVTKPLNPEKLLENIGQLLAVSTRKGYRVLLKAQMQGEREAAPFFCTSHNISATGMLFETDKILRQGDRISCTFFLPGACQIKTDGEIVRSLRIPDESVHYGVRFINLSPEYRREIEKFVANFADKK